MPCGRTQVSIATVIKEETDAEIQLKGLTALNLICAHEAGWITSCIPTLCCLQQMRLRMLYTVCTLCHPACAIDCHACNQHLVMLLFLCCATLQERQRPFRTTSSACGLWYVNHIWSCHVVSVAVCTLRLCMSELHYFIHERSMLLL